MDKIIIKGCIALVGPEAEASEKPVDIIIEKGKILDIRNTGEPLPDGTVIEGKNRLVTAGLINGHHHSHEHFYKGRYDNLPLELWMNYVRPAKPLPLTPRLVYLRTMIGAIEALRTGTTTIVDDVNISPVLNKDHVMAIYKAYEDIGIRAYVGLSLFDKAFYRAVPFVEEEFPPALLKKLDSGYRTPPEENLDFARELAESRHPDHNRVGYIVAPSAPQRCSKEFLLKTRKLADEFNLPLMTHVHETRLQVVTAQILYGMSMVEYLDTIGFLKEKTSLIHGVWLTPKDIAILKKTGATVQHNPNSNLKLGSGLAPVSALRNAGVNVSLASDGCGSIDTLNMLKVVNATALLHTLRGDDYKDWFSAREAWLAGTAGSARALGREHDLGSVEIGRIADLTIYRLDSIPFVPMNNPLNQLVYGENGASLDMTIVEGEIVMKDGVFTKIDEKALIAEIGEEFINLKPHLDESEKHVDQIKSAYERIYERCLKEPIDKEMYSIKLK